jgi:O-antigen/teichoic acid export membrane protein
LGLVERVVIARTLSVGAYGEVSTGIAIMSFGAIVALVGFKQAIPRYISQFDNERDRRGAWLIGLSIAGTISVIITAILVLGSAQLTELLFERPASDRLLTVFALCVPAFAVLEVGIGAIRGFENTIYRTYAYDLLYPGLRMIVLAGLLFAGFGAVAAGYAYLIALVVALVVTHLLLDRLISLVGSFRIHAREMVRFSLPLILATIVATLLARTDTLMIAYFRSSREVGLYTAAFPLALGLSVVLSAFGFLYLPLVSRLDADDRHGEINAVYQLTSKWIYIISFPGFLAFVIFSGDVLSIFFGDEYARASSALSILSIGFLANAAVGRSTDTLSAFGATKWILVSNIAAFGINFATNLVLIPRYGFTGAAVTSAVSYVALNVFVYTVLKRFFDITPLSSESIRTFVVLPSVLLPLGFLLSRQASLTILTLPVFLMVTGLITVVLVSVTGCLQPNDEIPLELVENRLDVTIPFIRRYIPVENEQ